MTLMLPFVLILAAMDAKTQVALEKDVISTIAGPAEITFVGHGSLMISFQDKIIHIDPYSKMTDYAVLPKADLILITHEHGDHVRGLDVLARRLNVPIHATAGTLHDFLHHRRTSDKPIDHHACRYHERFEVGDFLIEPFATSHDAAEPCGFIIREPSPVRARP